MTDQVPTYELRDGVHIFGFPGEAFLDFYHPHYERDGRLWSEVAARHEDHILERVRLDVLDGVRRKAFIDAVLRRDGGGDWESRFLFGVEHVRDRLSADPSGSTVQRPHWPVLAQEAMHGLAGEAVGIIAPHTEADPVTLLIQILLKFGNVVDRQPYCKAEADRHALNEFAVLVGLTSKGRKGTSSGHIEKLFERVDPLWTRQCIQSGLSSGEGLIWAVRDPIVRKNEVIDEGVTDKRLFVLEAEFASTLRVLGREGNTLSTIIRQAWDGKKLASLTKNAPGKATNAHLSIVGHITQDELLRYLGATEATNGFGNRFLWCCVRRSKTLPEGGHLEASALNDVVIRLKAAVEGARIVHEITRDHTARDLWREVYPVLSEGRPGLLGAMTSRAEAHVLRLSALYALLDGSSVVTETHLKAAIALWEYCEDSARFIFGDALGDPLADEIRDLLRANPDGLTTTGISHHFQRNKSSAQIHRALHLLEEHGLVTMKARETGGRKAMVWEAVGTK